MVARSKSKKKFSGFSKAEAFQLLNLKELTPWDIKVEPAVLSDFFIQHLQRLRRNFDLEGYEESKKLLIDAICDEAIDPFHHLRIWKGAKLESNVAGGVVDYLIAERQRYLTLPVLCVVEAKKDNFEQGLAQCLVEMHACQWNNQKNERAIAVLGILSNGSSWQFYKLDPTGEVFESSAYSTGDMAFLIARLRFIFQICEQSLNVTA
ncbi:MAG: hypothetical protein VKJ24_12910 [Synechococcales bacterium]|nr:hypothetical protein [Synechococcales bacterium]